MSAANCSNNVNSSLVNVSQLPVTLYFTTNVAHRNTVRYAFNNTSPTSSNPTHISRTLPKPVPPQNGHISSKLNMKHLSMRYSVAMSGSIIDDLDFDMSSKS